MFAQSTTKGELYVTLLKSIYHPAFETWAAWFLSSFSRNEVSLGIFQRLSLHRNITACCTWLACRLLQSRLTESAWGMTTRRWTKLFIVHWALNDLTYVHVCTTRVRRFCLDEINSISVYRTVLFSWLITFSIQYWKYKIMYLKFNYIFNFHTNKLLIEQLN